MTNQKNLTSLRREIANKLGSPTWLEADPATDAEQAQMLWKGVEADTGHPLLMHFLAKLIDKANIPARNPEALARAVQLYSARKIKFFRERPERFQSAMRTIVWGIGDCDDKSRFIAASLRSFRIPVKLKFLRYSVKLADDTIAKRGHVYPLAFIGGKWVPLESVREYKAGYDPEEKAKQLGFDITTQLLGDNENA
jgi:transglutaminase-like putative cysteine protease